LHSFLIPLVCGASLVVVFFGIGKLTLRFLRLGSLAWYWRLAFIALIGQTVVNFLVQALLLSGASSTHGLRILGWVCVAIGVAGQLFATKSWNAREYRNWFRSNRFLKALLVVVWVTNLAVALAPSSKIDEVHYHMLVPKRIAAEGTINYYRLPIESSMVPQMQYQISLSPTYAMGIPEAGNVLSLAYSIVLALFIFGFIREVSGNETLALLGTLGCVAGAYQTVWHTTEGAAAFGELALVVAVCGIIWPTPLMRTVKPLQYGLLIVTAACLAASTKISLLPLCGIVSLIAWWNTYRELRGTSSSAAATQAAAVLLPWIPIHLPLMIWTFRQSGSFWGPVMANVLRPSIFPPEMLAILVRMRVVNQSNFGLNMRFGSVELTPLLFLGVAWAFWLAIRVRREYAVIAALFLFQVALIYKLLPYDFRFLGGLQYVTLIATCVALASVGNGETQPLGLTPLGQRVVRYGFGIALVAIVPWIAFQMYYALPFAEATAGVMSGLQFRERFVALTDDYAALDKILPPDAVLFFDDARVSMFDAPRSAVMTPLDLRQRTSIYRVVVRDDDDKQLAAASEPWSGRLDANSILKCGEVVYSDTHAFVQNYRLAGRPPKIGSVIVQKCEVVPAAPTRNQ
jgi:hypothetical protein